MRRSPADWHRDDREPAFKFRCVELGDELADRGGRQEFVAVHVGDDAERRPGGFSSHDVQRQRKLGPVQHRGHRQPREPAALFLLRPQRGVSSRHKSRSKKALATEITENTEKYIILKRFPIFPFFPR